MALSNSGFSGIKSNVSKTNSTDDYYDKVKVDINAVLAFYLVVLVACLIGNVLDCVTVMKNREMRMKRWYYFLMNLSIADMAFALITPIHLVQVAGINVGEYFPSASSS